MKKFIEAIIRAYFSHDKMSIGAEIMALEDARDFINEQISRRKAVVRQINTVL